MEEVDRKVKILKEATADLDTIRGNVDATKDAIEQLETTATKVSDVADLKEDLANPIGDDINDLDNSLAALEGQVLIKNQFVAFPSSSWTIDANEKQCTEGLFADEGQTVHLKANLSVLDLDDNNIEFQLWIKDDEGTKAEAYFQDDFVISAHLSVMFNTKVTKTTNFAVCYQTDSDAWI